MDWYAVGLMLSDVAVVGGVVGFLGLLSVAVRKMVRSAEYVSPFTPEAIQADEDQVKVWLRIRDNAVGPQERDVAASMLQYLGYTEPALPAPGVPEDPRPPVDQAILQRLKDELAMARDRRNTATSKITRQAWADYEENLRAQFLNLGDRQRWDQAMEIKSAQANPDLVHEILADVYAVKEEKAEEWVGFRVWNSPKPFVRKKSAVSPVDEMLAICADVRNGKFGDPTGRRYECLHSGGTRLSDGTWINFTQYRAPEGQSFRLTDPSRNITLKGGLL